MRNRNPNRQSKTGLPRGHASKGRGQSIARAAGPLSRLNVWSRLTVWSRLNEGSARHHYEAARCRELGGAALDIYREQHDYRYRGTMHDIL